MEATAENDVFSGQAPDAIKVSFNGLRWELVKGLQELVSFLPEGIEEFITIGCRGPDSVAFFPFGQEEQMPLALLSDFVQVIFTLRYIYGLSAEEVKRIMTEEGGVQAIISNDEAWKKKWLS